MKKTIEELGKEWSYKEVEYKNLENENVEQVILLTRYKGDSAQVKVPSLIGEKIVRGIIYPGFSGNRSITSVQVPESIKMIGEQVFCDCKVLKEVEILGKNVIMGESCFSGCLELEKLQIDISSTEFGKHMFQGCSMLQDKNGLVILGEECKTLVDIELSYPFYTLTIPTGVIRLTGAALSSYYDDFQNIRNWVLIRKVDLPDSIREIGDDFFAGCVNLQQINIPKGVQKLGNRVFQECELLHEIHIPETVQEIGKEIFGHFNIVDVYGKPGSVIEAYANQHDNLYFVEELEDFSYLDDPLLEDFDIKNETLIRYLGFEPHLVIPDSVKRIGKDVLLHKEYTFETVEISGNTKIIGEGAFFFAGNIKRLILHDGIEVIGCNAFTNAMIEELVIPGTVKVIGKSAFGCCHKLRKVDINSGVEEIHDSAFEWCTELREVGIPETVNKIGENVFCGCERLKKIKKLQSTSFDFSHTKII